MGEKEKRQKHRPGYWRRSLSWTGYIASNGIESLLIAQLTFYLTESVMLSVATASGIIAASRVFDGISDLIAGYIIDHTHTRWGNARPYSLMTIVMWGAAVLLFSTPDIGNTGKIIYAFIMYNLADTIGRTMLFAAESVHFKKGFYDEEQINVLSFAGLISGIVGMVMNILMPIMISRIGYTDHGWTIIALALAVPGTIMGVMKFFFLPEMDMDEVLSEHVKNKTTIKQTVHVLLHNKYLFAFEGALLLRKVAEGMGISTFYFTYVVGDLEKMSIVSLFSLVSFVLMPLIPVLSKKMGVKNFMSVFLLAGGIASLLMYLAPTNLAMLSFGSAMGMLASIPISMLMSLIAVQCMKYTEWKENVQIDGVISSMNGLSQKVGTALGALISGFMLSAAGYIGGVEAQTASAVDMLKFLYCGFTGILMVAGGLLIRLYTVEDKLPQIEKDLEERRARKMEK